VIYTGRRSEHLKRVVRDTNSTASTATSSTTVPTSIKPKQDAGEYVFWQRERLLLYYHKFESVDTTGARTPIEIENLTVTESGSSLDVVMTALGGNIFAFNITGEAAYWWIDQIAYTDQPLRSSHRIAAVDNFSFHCSPVIVLTASNIVLEWTGLQIQPLFGTLAGQPFETFGDSWDCVGFVSPGIVGGLFVVIMLLFILSIGISWMMDINTMDRFDDPKGKTITISVNE
jgi:V-type H+-transporting ATPase S1 subunit